MFSVLDDDVDEKDDSKRKTRNLSEKKRRDQFNTLVNELSAMVSPTSRKMDKSTVLRSTISFLKNYNEVSIRSKVHDIHEDWKPAFLSNEEFMHLILEAFDGFTIVFASSGRILYTSGNITSLLGYLPSDVLNMSIYDMMLEEDHTSLYNLFLNPPTVIDPAQDALSIENQVCFRCHLKRGGLNYRDVVAYELVQFTGYFRAEVKYEKSIEPDELDVKPGNIVDSKYIFVGTTRIRKPKLIREMSINGAKKSEFTSRHSLEWKFLFLDHRAPPIIGYLPIEVLGTSGYDYYHFDDLEQVAQCHEALKHKGEGTSCYYRFLTKGQQWLWLQTRYYITYHQWTSKPEFIVCTHRVINYVDVVQQMRRNNGRVEDGEDVDNSADSVERQLNTSASSMMITSPWSSQSSRSRVDGRPSTPSVSNFRHRYNTYQGTCTGESNFSELSGSQQFTESDLAMPLKSSPPLQTTTTTVTALHATTVALQSFTTEVSQFVATYTVPVEPATLLTTSFPSPVVLTNTHLESLHGAPVLTVSPQTLLQDQLQRKHEELQLMIGHQQDELRRVSEQLVMARYGIPIVSVALPIPNVDAMPKPASSTADSNRYSPDNNSDRLSVSSHECQSHHQHQQQQQHHHHQQQQQFQQHQRQYNQHYQQHHQHHIQYQPDHHQPNQNLQHQSHPQLMLQGASVGSGDVIGGGGQEEEVLSYMQLQPVTSLHQYTHHVLQQQRHGHDQEIDALSTSGVMESHQQVSRHDADGEG